MKTLDVDVSVGDEVVVLIKGKTLKGRLATIKPGTGRIFSILITDTQELRSVERNQIKSFKASS